MCPPSRGSCLQPARPVARAQAELPTAPTRPPHSAVESDSTAPARCYSGAHRRGTAWWRGGERPPHVPPRAGVPVVRTAPRGHAPKAPPGAAPASVSPRRERGRATRRRPWTRFRTSRGCAAGGGHAARQWPRAASSYFRAARRRRRVEHAASRIGGGGGVPLGRPRAHPRTKARTTRRTDVMLMSAQSPRSPTFHVHGAASHSFAAR